ncbi:MAG: type secretion system protein TrbB [Pseudomonadota bacterium]|nr:type secretion system protein TrbB [Pseudomonadota bacterium]
MAKEMDSAQILRHLEEDMGNLLRLFDQKNVYEVILNSYLREDGTYEGHIWYEHSGKGMVRAINETKIDISRYSTPKIGDIVFYRYVDEEDGRRILNYHVLPQTASEIRETIGIVLKNSIITDLEGNDYLNQEEHFKLNVLADNIAKQNQYYYREPIPTSDIENIQLLVDTVNKKLGRLIGIAFKVGIIEVVNEGGLAQFNRNPQYILTKEFVKMTASKAEQIMGILAAANGGLHFHEKEPRLECSIPFYHHRFTGQRSPIVTSPSFTIRKHGSTVKDLSEYVNEEIMPSHVAQTIRDWIFRGYGILIAGGTGSGKTTMLNSIIRETARIHPNLRAGIIEDTPEIKCDIENSFLFRKSKEVSIDDLLVTSLRMRPDSITVGEVRSKEAYTLFKAMLTGHRNCYGTIHASGAYEATFRFEQCVKEHPDCANSPVPRHQIALALNGIISIQKTTVRVQRNGYYENVIKRKVTALREIIGYDPKHDIYEDIMLYQDKEAVIEEKNPQEVNKFKQYQ